MATIVPPFIVATTSVYGFKPKGNRQPTGCRFHFYANSLNWMDSCDLCRFLRRERLHPSSISICFSHDSHLLPVVGQFLAAIQTDNVRAGHRRCTTTAGTGTNCLRETDMRMPATEERVKKLCHHTSNLPRTPGPSTTNCKTSASVLPEYLDSNRQEKVRLNRASPAYSREQQLKTVAHP